MGIFGMMYNGKILIVFTLSMLRRPEVSQQMKLVDKFIIKQIRFFGRLPLTVSLGLISRYIYMVNNVCLITTRCVVILSGSAVVFIFSCANLDDG